MYNNDLYVYIFYVQSYYCYYINYILGNKEESSSLFDSAGRSGSGGMGLGADPLSLALGLGCGGAGNYMGGQSMVRYYYCCCCS